MAKRIDVDSISLYISATTMPNKKAAIKDLRQNLKRQARNTRIKTNVKHKLKDAQQLIKEGKAEAKDAVRALQKAAAKAAKKKTISKNRARRITSKLMKSANPKKA